MRIDCEHLDMAILDEHGGTVSQHDDLAVFEILDDFREGIYFLHG